MNEPRCNEFGQPIGAPLPGWSRRPLPPRSPIQGDAGFRAAAERLPLDQLNIDQVEMDRVRIAREVEELPDLDGAGTGGFRGRRHIGNPQIGNPWLLVEAVEGSGGLDQAAPIVEILVQLRCRSTLSPIRNRARC